MVYVGSKQESERTAEARGRVLVNEKTFDLIEKGGMKKGDVLGTAQIAGITAAKKTWDIIPMCHPLLLTGIDISFEMNREDLAVEIKARVSCRGVTGVEMEALTAVFRGPLSQFTICARLSRRIW